jgi:hypothetical protein
MTWNMDNSPSHRPVSFYNPQICFSSKKCLQNSKGQGVFWRKSNLFRLCQGTFPQRGNSTNTQMTSLRKGPCSPRAQPPWKMTRVRNRETSATCQIWQAAANSWSSRLISPALCSCPAFIGKGRGKRLWPAFLFLLTKPSTIGLPWPRARPARPLPACGLPWQWRCAFCQGSSWQMGGPLPAKQIY